MSNNSRDHCRCSSTGIDDDEMDSLVGFHEVAVFGKQFIPFSILPVIQIPRNIGPRISNMMARKCFAKIAALRDFPVEIEHVYRLYKSAL